MTRARPDRAPALALSGHGDRPGTPEAPPRHGSTIATIVVAGVAVLLLIFYYLVMNRWVLAERGVASTRLGPPRSASGPATAVATDPPIEYPEAGDGTWLVAGGVELVAGAGGRLVRFGATVESGITGIEAGRFGAEVLATLGAPGGWTASGERRFQLVGADQEPDFTVFLATPTSRDVLCQSDYDRYTSCRAGDRVVLNVARWANGVPQYETKVAGYRKYLVNHEVGHWLGYEHELCPGQGQPAPVMQQQTLGLHGCTPNAVVFRDGARYAGPPGEYDDPVPG